MACHPSFEPFLQLPDELLFYTLTHLALRLGDLARLSMTCYRLYSLCSRNSFWREIVRRIYPHLFADNESPTVSLLVSQEMKSRVNPPLSTSSTQWKLYLREKIQLHRPGALHWEKVPKRGEEIPEPRFTHTGTHLESGDIYYIGGQTDVNRDRLDDIFRFDTTSHQFYKCSLRSGRTPIFARHSAVSDPAEKSVVIYGGYDGKGEFFHLARFDPTNLSWTTPSVTGDIPTPRSNHCAARIGKNMYIYGGSNNSNKGEYTILGDFYELDLMDWKWRKIEHGGVPTPRVGHSMTSLGDRLYLYGGGLWNAKENWVKLFNELYVFEAKAERWVKVTGKYGPDMVMEEKKKKKKKKRRLSGEDEDATEVEEEEEEAEEREAKKQRTLEEEKAKKKKEPLVSSYPLMFGLGFHIFLFGGQHIKKRAVTGELWVFDTIGLEWTKMTLGEPARETTSCSAEPPGRQQERKKPLQPSPRDMGAASVVWDEHNPRVYVFGGYCGGPIVQDENDFWCLKFRNVSFVPPQK